MKKEITISVTYSKTVNMEVPENENLLVYEIRDKVLPPLSKVADNEDWIEDDFDFIVE